MIRRILVARRFIACCAVLGGLVLTSCAQATRNRLFTRFESPATSDGATHELIKRGQADPQTRAFLAARVPAVILDGPSGKLIVWLNAVSIASALKLAEACGPLSRWMTLGGPTFLIDQSELARLEYWPAAEALAEIGDPALPSLVGVLGGAGMGGRLKAIQVLRKIHSEAAKRVLEQHLPRENDEHDRYFVKRILELWEAEPAGKDY